MTSRVSGAVFAVIKQRILPCSHSQTCLFLKNSPGGDGERERGAEMDRVLR